MKRYSIGFAVLAAMAGLIMFAGCAQTGDTQSAGTTKPATTESPKPKAAAAAPTLRQGFTCCNLHYEGDWINDGNYAQLPMIPAGTPAKVLSYGRNRAPVDIGGKPFRLGHDYGREQESLEQWVAKIIVEQDPKTKLAGYPADVQEAIRQGRIMPGMTKEQVIMSIGHPLTSENPTLDGPMWRHWWSSFGEYQIMWGSDGKVKDIITDPVTKNMVVYQPK